VNRGTGQYVAVKKVSNALHDNFDATQVLRDIKLMRHFNHENVSTTWTIRLPAFNCCMFQIVALLDIEPLPPPEGFKDVYVFTELMQTDLHRVIYSRQKLSPEHKQYFMYQILRALKCVHSADVVHRDLKPSCILLNSNCDLKITNFKTSW
jgi:serine/threonine protein kinase